MGVVLAMSAQTTSDNFLPQVENILKVKYGWNSSVDPYLSPLRYNGNHIAIGNEWWGNLLQTKQDSSHHWIYSGRLDISGLRAYSSQKSNLIYGLGAQAGWGSFYQWKPIKGLRLGVGPYLQADVYVKQHASEVNKPYSVDAAIDAMAMVYISWTLYAKRTSYRFGYQARTNLIGAQFQPDYWQSYYEIYENKLRGNIGFSAPHNRNMLCQQAYIDFQFPHSTWRIGAEHEFLRYSGKDITWIRNNVAIVIGCIWQYKIKGGQPL